MDIKGSKDLGFKEQGVPRIYCVPRVLGSKDILCSKNICIGILGKHFKDTGYKDKGFQGYRVPRDT